MVELPPEILQHYASIDEGRRLTTSAGRLEFVRTQEIITRYLPQGSLRILDVGGATGVHAQWLAELGHQVHIVDVVESHVAAARRAWGEGGPVQAVVGDARELPLAAEQFDAVLLLGPLYHLTEREDRLLALREARRVLRPGRHVFAAAISRFASLFDGLSRGFLSDAVFRAIVERDLRDGQHRNPTANPEWFTTAYFHHPDELATEANDAGLTVEAVFGLEGLAGWIPDLAERLSDPQVSKSALFASRAVESEPSLLGLSAHLLMVAAKPSEGSPEVR